MSLGNRFMRILMLAGLLVPLNGLSESSGEANPQWLPRNRNYAALSEGKDCAVYQTLVERAQADVDVNRNAIQQLKSELMTRRQDLEGCGRTKGMTRFSTEEDETRLAERCPSEYQEWIGPGTRLEMFRQDLATAKQSIQRMQGEINVRCGGRGQGKRALPVKIEMF